MVDEEIKKLLSHKIRKRIYYLILKYPGIHFNELIRKHNFASGQLTYHLHILEKNKLIYRTTGKVVNYYSVEAVEKQDNKYLQYLRDKRKREIINIILVKKVVSSTELKEELKLAHSTLSWHLKDLIHSDIIIVKTSKKKKYYFFSKEVEESLSKLIKEEKKSVISNLVDSFIELWNEEFK